VSRALSPPPRPQDVRRILIRANNWIGDVVMISPAARAIREHFRQARISILAKRWVLDTLRGHPFYDDLIEFDDDGAHRGIRGRVRLGLTLRRERFDLAVLFQKAFEAAWLAFLAGARRRIGHAADARAVLLTDPLPLPPPGTHHVELFLGIARALGCVIRDPRPVFHVPDDADREADRILDRAALAGRAPLIAIHPGASKLPRAWHASRFGLLAGLLAAETGTRVLILGGPADAGLLGQVAAAAGGAGVVPDPGMPIGVTAGLLARCHLFVGNDSGPLHLAAALGVPALGIFGPGDPRRTAPFAARAPVAVLTRRYPCSPCRQDFFRECPPGPGGKPFCLEEIGVDEAVTAALELLSRSRVGG
jgi:lipopolysaccharide heptosyltransferase II